MNPSRFDDLTKALARATSRRQALKTIAATTLGSILGLGGLGTAFAKNKTCAHFCASVFGANTPAAEQCTSDAAHHKGLCSTCGSNADPSSMCCTRNAGGFCSSYSPTLPCSCPSGQTCSNGQCVSICPSLPACNDTCPCPSGQTCLGGSCCTTANVCGSTCLAAPCDSSLCLSCDSSTGTCVGCPSGQTCSNGQCIPNCIADGGGCSVDGDCCSGPCCNGVCCGSGHVCLSNGTCAIPCNLSTNAGCSGSCVCTPDVSGAGYCSNGGAGNGCNSDSDCLRGQFCFPDSNPSFYGNCMNAC